MKTFRQFILVSCVILIGAVSVARAQTPDAPKPASVLTPEQMVEEALRRFDMGDYQEAYTYAQRVKAQKPELDKLKLVLGLLNLEMRPRTPSKNTEAINLLNDYNNSTEGKNDYRGHAALGRVFKESRMYQQAQRPLDKARSLAPVDHDGKPLRAMVTMDLAACYFGMKKEKQAITTAKEAESLAPNDPGIQLELGRIASNTKDYDAAVKAADRAIGLLMSKSRTDPYKIQDLKDLEECVELKIKVFLSKLEENAKDARTCADLAAALREKADIERRMYLVRAREYGIKGVAIEPKNFKLQVFTARVEADLGGLQDAVDRLNDTVNNDPDNQEAIKLRGELQARMAAPHP